MKSLHLSKETKDTHSYQGTIYFKCLPALLLKGVGGGGEGRNAFLSDSITKVQNLCDAIPPAAFLANNGSWTQF